MASVDYREEGEIVLQSIELDDIDITIQQTLRKIDIESRPIIIEELVNSYELTQLLDVREKLFVYAKAKCEKELVNEDFLNTDETTNLP